MEPARAKPATIDEYIAARPPEVRAILEQIRSTVRRAAPNAKEKISYGMPTFVLGKVLIHFGGFKDHIGLFPPVKDEELLPETRPYAGEKGNLRFPLDQPIPYDLIGRIVKARVEQRRAK